MKIIKYFFEYTFAIISFSLFKILGLKISSKLSGKIFEKIGPMFRSRKIIHSNIKRAFPNIDKQNLNKITNSMWNNYGRIFAEYIFIKDFREGKFNSNIIIEGQEIIEDLIKNEKQVVFISGHLANFELMAMHLEKSGIKLSAIYRPLNNIFLNSKMEKIRKNYICKYQIKKGLGGIRNLISLKRKKFSTALMIDQRVTEGILSKFFNKEALTTTIPAQIVKKFKTPIVPVYIERIEDIKFKIIIKKQLNFSEDASIQEITDKLNKIFEEMVLNNPEQWIWSHNRWK